jgi:hypothetical protein
MPLGEQLDYSNAFSNYENWDLIRRDERQAWIRLDVLDQHAPVAAADWAGVRQALSQAVADDARAAAVGPFIFQTANVGRKPTRVTAARLFRNEGYGAELCRPILPRPAKGKAG